ncbi:hypothetical protein MHUMG1_09196 [Metarhizium humberi]|uniref:Carrier domain-containing protein n=1 Tax=Metarhizium humberi TaxID=2596975 RepID=A0A9P8M2Q8_9HYPO|nr:hypothetical protein MHUMG1_09196 [Metarhizium humberi]
MDTWNCLQDVLRDRAESGSVLSFPLGDVSDPICISYKDLYFQARRNSGQIRRIQRFKERHPIMLHLDNHADIITWFWSVLFANGIPVILGPSIRSNSSVLDLAVLLEYPICITTSDLTDMWDSGHGMYLHRVETPQKTASRAISSAEPNSHGQYQGGTTTAILMLTSGSSGSPKAAMLSHRQILVVVAGKAAVRPLESPRPFLNWIGLDHVASLVEIHIQALWLGVDQVHVHASDVVSAPTTFLSLLHRYKVAKTFAPNFLLAKLLSALQDEQQDRNWDLTNLTMLASGGEDTDTSTCVNLSSILQRYNAPANVITAGFGMTETCAGAIFNVDCPEYDVKRGRAVVSLGTCMDGIEMRITNPGLDRSQLAAPDEPGDLEVRGSVLFSGYYRDARATAECFTQDGWFRTGDQASIDAQGHLSLKGRVKDLVNINGAKFAMAPLQTALDQALCHQAARLVAFPSRAAHTEQVTVAYIPRNWDMPVKDVVEIQHLAVQTCLLRVGASPTVFSLRQESIPLLPVSSLGKISRTKMRTLYEAGAFSKDVDLHFSRVEQFRKQRQKMDDTEANDAEKLLIRCLLELKSIDRGAIGVNTSIFELGFTSIDVIQLKIRIEEALGASVSVTSILRHPTPSALAKALCPESEKGRSLDTRLNSSYDPVVAFNAAGQKTPLWLVHPGIGEVLVFVGLAQHIASDDRPVYALRARGLDPGQEQFVSIDEVVDAYLAALRQRQPQGPYVMAGYSYGTMIAFEMAKKLEATDGHGTVQFLGCLNLPPHIKTRMRQLNWQNCLLHLAYFLSLITEEQAEQIEDMSQDDALAYVFRLADADRIKELGLDKPGLTRWTNVAHGLPNIAVNYEPDGQVDMLDIFYATPLKSVAPDRTIWVKEHLSKWQDFCRSKPRLHEVDGSHYTMIGPDHVAAFSATFLSALHARGV